MKVIRTVDGVRSLGSLRARAGATLGLVPTMGFLHEGHLSLVRRAREENELVAVSVFVNPAQFNEATDLASYPRDLDRDLDRLRAEGVDWVFAPDASQLYPEDFETWVQPGSVATPLEGSFRPGHFRGVATVVLKLLNLFQPDRAYFGQKDAQQLALIRRLVHDLNVLTEIVGVATFREPDGLAMSSRNVNLPDELRPHATALYRALLAGQDLVDSGETQADSIRLAMRRVLDNVSAACDGRLEVEYASVADPRSLRELEQVVGPALLCIAAHLGPVRLIDNLLVESPTSEPVDLSAQSLSSYA